MCGAAAPSTWGSSAPEHYRLTHPHLALLLPSRLPCLAAKWDLGDLSQSVMALVSFPCAPWSGKSMESCFDSPHLPMFPSNAPCSLHVQQEMNDHRNREGFREIGSSLSLLGKLVAPFGLPSEEVLGALWLPSNVLGKRNK